MLQPLLQVGLLVLGALGAGEVGVGAARVAAHVLPSHRGIQPAIQLTLHPSGINQFHQGVGDIEFSSAGLFGALVQVGCLVRLCRLVGFLLAG